MGGIPSIPLGIGPPNVLGLVFRQGFSDLDFTTVTGVTLTVTKTLTGEIDVWPCAILSATPTLLTAGYSFQSAIASGSFAPTTGQKAIPATSPNAVPVGALVTFSSQPLVQYAVVASSTTSITLATAYTGSTNAAATVAWTGDVNVLGTYELAATFTVPGGLWPSYSMVFQATPPGQTNLRNP